MKTGIIFFACFIVAVNGCLLEGTKCTCDEVYKEAIITCTGIESEQELVRILSPLVGQSSVTSLTIVDAVMNYIPHDTFKGMKFSMIDIVNSSLMALSDTDVAFEGLEENLRYIIIDNCYFMNEWDWCILKNLKNLTSFTVRNSDLESIDDMKCIDTDKLTHIDMSHHNIFYIEDMAFSNAKKLSYFKLNNNFISELKRSMLPDPANYLLDIDVRFNKIEKFPEDMFSNMSHLSFLDISHNSIMYLDEQVFKPIWSDLIKFSALGTDLSCDCRLSWIVQTSHPTEVYAFCDQPQDLKGKNVVTVHSRELWCFA